MKMKKWRERLNEPSQKSNRKKIEKGRFIISLIFLRKTFISKGLYDNHRALKKY